MHIFRPVSVLYDDLGLGEAYSQNRPAVRRDWYSLFYGGNRLAEAIHESEVKTLTIHSARWPVGVLLCVIPKQLPLRLVASILLLLLPPQPSPLSLHGTNLRQCPS
jgi:hypothetical protein